MSKTCKHCGVELTPKRNNLACTVCKNGIDRYGLNRLQQLELLKSQAGRCKLCNKEIKMFARHHGGFVDHNHDTGKVRGILCSICNVGVAFVETRTSLEVVTSYLSGNGAIW